MLARRTMMAVEGFTCVAGHLLLGRMGLVGEALMLLSVLRGVLAVLRVLGGMWRVLLWVLAVGWVLPVRSVCSVLWVLAVLAVLTVLAVLAVLVVGAAVLREVLRVGWAVAGVGLSRMGEGHLAAAARVVVWVTVGLVICQAVRSVDGATGGVLIGAGGVSLLGRIWWYTHQAWKSEDTYRRPLTAAATTTTTAK